MTVFLLPYEEAEVKELAEQLDALNSKALIRLADMLKALLEKEEKDWPLIHEGIDKVHETCYRMHICVTMIEDIFQEAKGRTN